ncbi:hypothetical protein ACUXV3_12500 [Roseobacteraceae bacterium NS-SX3]
MFARITGAALRGILVALLIAMPSLLLPSYATETPEIVVFMALLGGGLTFAEYFSSFPSFVEFREAPPLNRMRFLLALAVLSLLSLLTRHGLEPTALTALVHGVGHKLGSWLDFPYSPVRLMLLMLPPEVPLETAALVRAAAAIAYLAAAAAIAGFVLVIRLYNWPVGQGAFNVWVNLPLFDPTTGGDVVGRLRRDGRLNVIAGVLLPFAVPAAVQMAAGETVAALAGAPQALIWLVAAWACVPAMAVLRGLAMLRVAGLIARQRRAAYAEADPEAMQAA